MTGAATTRLEVYMAAPTAPAGSDRDGDVEIAAGLDSGADGAPDESAGHWSGGKSCFVAHLSYFSKLKSGADFGADERFFLWRSKNVRRCGLG